MPRSQVLTRRIRGGLAVAATIAVVGTALVAAPAAVAAPTATVTVAVTGADVAAAAQNRNGLTFKGFGVLSANSTSALLLDYKAQHPEKYWEVHRDPVRWRPPDHEHGQDRDGQRPQHLHRAQRRDDAHA
ncbi:hypothetical protein [Pseudoxanthomonas mexicana]